MNKNIKKIFFSLVVLLGAWYLTSCGTPLDTTIDEINQRYKDNNPMTESDVRVRFKEPLNQRVISTTEHMDIWVPNYDSIDDVKKVIENGQEVIGVFVKFEKTTKKFPRLNEETLEMEWYEKLVVEAIWAEKKNITLNDLK